MIEQQISSQEIINAAEQMSLSELEKLVERMIVLQAERRAPHLKADETKLMTRINQTMSDNERIKLDELVQKRKKENITQAELEELTRMTDVLEEMHADRVEALADLAQLRGKTLDAVMQELGIKFPDHG